LRHVSIKHDIEIIYELGKLVWFPYLRIKYKSPKKMDVLFSCFTSNLTGTPQSTILLARNTGMFKFSTSKICRGKIIEVDLDSGDIISDIEETYRFVKMGLEKHIDEFREEIDLNIDWNRFRALFIPSQRLLERKEPIFKYLWGRRRSPIYSVLSFLKFLIEEGLGYRGNEIYIRETEKVYYPIVITNNDEFFEIGWKFEKSLSYSWLYESSEKFRNFITERIGGHGEE